MKPFKEYLNKKTKSPAEIADKFGVTFDYIIVQMNAGISVEHEHTTSNKIAREIALDHLSEDPKYYIKLKKMDK